MSPRLYPFVVFLAHTSYSSLEEKSQRIQLQKVSEALVAGIVRKTDPDGSGRSSLLRGVENIDETIAFTGEG
jgi:hypothetical protein